MNRKQLVILLVLVVVIGGAGLLLRQKQDKSWTGNNPNMGSKLLGDFPVNNVTQISLKQGSQELNLVKKDDLWRVRERGDYPANYSEISGFLLKLSDLKIVQSEKVGPSQLPRLSLAPGEGTNAALVVDFKDQGQKSIRTLLLGKKHMKKGGGRPSQFGDMGEQGWPDGRWVKVGSESDTVILISDPLSNIEPRPEQWLNKDFFKIEKARSVAVTFPNATNSWKLTRETESGEWKLAESQPSEQLDTSKASGVVNPLQSPSFTDVAAGAKPEDYGLDKPTTATIETFDNFTYTLKLGQKTNDNIPLALSVAGEPAKERTPAAEEKPEDKERLDKEFKEKQKKIEEKLAQEKPYEKWVYLVSSWTVDPLLQERSKLLVEKKEEPKDGKKEEPGHEGHDHGVPPPVSDGNKAGTPVPLAPPAEAKPPAEPKPEAR